MGIRVEDPDYGNDCLTCFAPGATPLRINASFGNIKKGSLWEDELPGPPSGSFKLTQNPSHPCQWAYVGEVWSVEYYAVAIPPGEVRAQLLMSLNPPFSLPVFQGNSSSYCAGSFGAFFTDPEGWAYYSGSAWIFV